MEASAVQHIPAIIEQAAKSPLGLFALMVIALSGLGFVFFRRSSERTRIAMFVMLFVGVASFGVAAMRITPGAAAAAPPPVVAVADIGGEWRAEVKYDWGDTHNEDFAFNYDGTEVLGTASYLGKKRALFEGQLKGDRISFITKSQQSISSDNSIRDVVHHYTGKVAGDRIQFTLRSEGGFTEHVPVEFSAVRAR
ncbi:MAG: hypothetical protein AABZ84_00170 [Pseudomonadota bacterium]